MTRSGPSQPKIEYYQKNLKKSGYTIFYELEGKWDKIFWKRVSYLLIFLRLKGNDIKGIWRKKFLKT